MLRCFATPTKNDWLFGGKDLGANESGPVMVLFTPYRQEGAAWMIEINHGLLFLLMGAVSLGEDLPPVGEKKALRMLRGGPSS